MNRRQKIIVSVTGIFIVLLILIGLTYGYFLTRITGNGNPTSISVTTANLELVYGDGTTSILTSENPLMPSSTPIGTKDFTVTNNGDDSEYVVVFEDVRVKYAADIVINEQAVTAGTDTTFESNDFVYTLTCTKKDGTGCEGVENETFPMDGGIVVGNNIDKDDVHSYVLTLYYLDNGLDQSKDMNKTLNGKVNIKDIKSINPYSENKQSLAYNIINNSVLNKNGTQLVATPPSKVAEEVSLESWEDGTERNIYLNNKNIKGYSETEYELWRCYDGYEDVDSKEWLKDCSAVTEYKSCTDDIVGKYIFDVKEYTTYYVDKCENGKVVVGTTKYEKVLSTSPDDYAISYYYRGNVEDNYVNFAGMCWKIVRIAGDGSTKLILEDQYTTCDDTEDTDGTETADYAYRGNWIIGTGNYGYDSSSKSTSGNTLYKMNYLNPVTDNTSSMVKAFYNFQTTGKLKDYTSKLKAGGWCLNDRSYASSKNLTPLTSDEKNAMYLSETEFYYNVNFRKNPTFKCKGTILNEFSDVENVSSKIPMYVSTLTADEIVYAGGKDYSSNYNYYLMNDYSKDNQLGWWTLSPSLFFMTHDYAFNMSSDYLYSDVASVINVSAFRPSVSLASNAVITDGEGTLEKPYIIG